jgi:hypothetical protein
VAHVKQLLQSLPFPVHWHPSPSSQTEALPRPSYNLLEAGRVLEVQSRLVWQGTHRRKQREGGAREAQRLQFIPLVGNQQRPPGADRPRLLPAAPLGEDAPGLLPVKEEDVDTACAKSEGKAKANS